MQILQVWTRYRQQKLCILYSLLYSKEMYNLMMGPVAQSV